MVGITAAMVGEAFTFGERGGTDWLQKIEVINNSVLASMLLGCKAPLLRDRDYGNPQSSVVVAAKDIDLALATPQEMNIPLPVTGLVREFQQSMQAQGHGGLNFIGIVTLFEDWFGVGVCLEIVA